MGLLATVKEINEGGGLGFITGRQQGEFDTLLNRPIVIEDIAFVESKYYDGENAIFIIKGDPHHFYRTSSKVAVNQLKKLQDGLNEDGLDWNVLTITFEPVRSKGGNKYYVVKVTVDPEVEAQLLAQANDDAERQVAL